MVASDKSLKKCACLVPGYNVIDVGTNIKGNYQDVRSPSFMQGFNRRWFASKLKTVYLPHSTEEALCCAEDALFKFPLGSVKVLSGAHSYEGFVFNDDVRAIISVSAMEREYGYDPDKGFFLSSGDTNWNAFRRLFNEHGLILPGGSCYSVGLGGHISGGGVGVLSRLHGNTVDHLTGVEIITKAKPDEEAKLSYVSADHRCPSHRRLFWALRGAGCGNYGIITKYYFKSLPKAPQYFVVSYITFSWDSFPKCSDSTKMATDQDSITKFRKLINWYFEFAKSAPNSTTGKFPIMHRAAKEFTLYIYSACDNKEQVIEAKDRHYQYELQVEHIVASIEPTKMLGGGHGGWSPFPLRPRKKHTTKESFMNDDTIVYPTYSVVQTMNGSGPNQRGKYKSAYNICMIPNEQVKKIFHHLGSIPDGLEETDMTESIIQMDIFGGKCNTVPPTDTAIYQRRYNVKFQYQTYWAHSDKDDAHLSWIRDFYNDMYAPYGGVPDPRANGGDLFQGCYFNYPDVDLNDWQCGRYGALYLYFNDNLDKLIEIKKEWDPSDYFRHTQSIPTQTLRESGLKDNYDGCDLPIA